MDPATARRLQNELDGEVKHMNDIQKQVAALTPLRQKLLTQYNESEMVLKELALVKQADASASVYKLVGPVLIKQDNMDAYNNVDSRIKYFKAEIERIDKQEKDLLDKRNQQAEKIQKIQNTAREAYQAAVNAATRQQSVGA